MLNLILPLLGILVTVLVLYQLYFSFQPAARATPPPPASAALQQPSAVALLDMGQTLIDRGDFDGAFECFTRAGGQMGTSPMGLMSDRIEGGAFKPEAIAWAERWIEEHAAADNFEPNVYTAAVLVSECGTAQRAIRVLEKALARNPGSTGARAALVIVRLEDALIRQVQGDEWTRLIEESRPVIEQIAADPRSSSDPQWRAQLKANFLSFTTEREVALESYLRLLNESEMSGPNLLENELVVGTLGLWTGQERLAEEHFRQIISTHGRLENGVAARSWPFPELAVGALYFFSSESPSPQLLRDVTSKLPQRPAPGSNQASTVWGALYQVPSALHTLQTASDPQRLRQVVAQGNTLEASLPRSVENSHCPVSLGHAVPLARAVSQLMRAEAYEKLGQPARALEHYRRALEIFPDSSVIKKRLQRAEHVTA